MSHFATEEETLTYFTKLIVSADLGNLRKAKGHLSSYMKTDTTMPRHHKPNEKYLISLLQDHIAEIENPKESVIMEDELISKEASSGTVSQTYSEYELAVKFLNLHKSASRRNLQFNLTIADLKKVLRRATCYYTGRVLTKGKPLTDTVLPHGSDRTIERLDRTKGYIKGNVVSCSHSANQLKNKLFEAPENELTMSLQEFRKFASMMF